MEDKRVQQEQTPFQWHIKKHDLVEVTDGPEAGRRGKVLWRNPRYNEVIVEGINLTTTEELDSDSSPFDPAFESKSRPQPIYFRSVSLVCPQLDRATDVYWEVRNGQRVRVAVESGMEIPLPAEPVPWEGKDYAESLCTRRADVLEATYKPLPSYSLTRARQAAAAASGRVEDPSSGENPSPDGETVASAAAATAAGPSAPSGEGAHEVEANEPAEAGGAEAGGAEAGIDDQPANAAATEMEAVASPAEAAAPPAAVAPDAAVDEEPAAGQQGGRVTNGEDRERRS